MTHSAATPIPQALSALEYSAADASSESIAGALRRHPFMERLADDHLNRLSTVCVRRWIPEGETLYIEGRRANRFYLVEQGRVAIEAFDEKGASRRIEERGPGDVVGWSALFPPYKCVFDARVIEPTLAVFLYAAAVREFAQTDPAFASAWNELVASGLYAMQRRQQVARSTAKDLAATVD